MNERVFNPSRETQRILGQAKAIGAATHKLCETLFEREGRVGQRKLWGIVGLVRRYLRRLINMWGNLKWPSGRDFQLVWSN